MADNIPPGVGGGTHDSAYQYQSIAQQEGAEEKMLDHGRPSWREDIADAQRKLRRQRNARYKQVLLGMAAAAVLLTPLAFFHRMRQPYPHMAGCQASLDGEQGLVQLPYGQLDQWLSSLQQQQGHCDAVADTTGADWLGEGTLASVNGTDTTIPPVFQVEKHKKHHKKKHHKKHWVPYEGNGRFYIDPEQWHELDFGVKACKSWSWLSVTHDAPKEDEPSEDGEPVHPAMPEWMTEALEGDDDDDDGGDDGGDDDGGDDGGDDDHKDKIIVDFKAFVAKKYSQKHLRVVEEKDEEHGRYTWRLENAHPPPSDQMLDDDDDDDHDHPKHPHPPPPPHHPGHPHPPPPPHHPKHPKLPKHVKVVVKLHVRLPASLSSLDALGLGIRKGAIHVPSLKHVQLGQFRAGAVFGRVHAGEINAATHIELGTVHGAAILYRSQAEAIKVGSVSGLVHVTRVAARQALEVGTTWGEAVVHGVDAADGLVKAGTVAGANTVVGVCAAQLYVGSVRGEVQLYANVSDTARVKSVSSPIRGHINHHPHHDSSDRSPDAPNTISRIWHVDEERDEEEGTAATIYASTVSGQVALYVAHFKGAFRMGSVVGALAVKGPHVHLVTDTRHSKQGYVGDKEDADNGQLVLARSVTGPIALQFDV
ncbi:hypothetical protein SYNPS1DRAFT_27696 [Syncephalis pseudoplumigaleata]|uniref:Adhesin domain-containing protein n=1 Tax=Syncephalis pseudoplumigaleata TaxID=1712513 RepID=A0A4P9Z2B5_9FUNG|nr:hypothetical protein SYNPS1DRAFT_27696 [Syncephalis pseudoplumigaleata]|eukprot:RKP26624.1 hypothetical protein SYNPS1DRAFT_27696 [Syncephalis pseudoplumigaleata]